MATGSSRFSVMIKTVIGDGSKTPEETANQISQIVVQNDAAAAKVQKTKEQLLALDQKLEGQMRAALIKYQGDIVKLQSDIVEAKQSTAGITQSVDFAQFKLKAAIVKAIEDETEARAKVTALQNDMVAINNKTLTASDKVKASEGIQNRLVMAQYELDRKIARSELQQQALKESEQAKATALAANAAEIKAAQDVLGARNAALAAKEAELAAKSKEIEINLESAKSKGMNVWYVLNGLLHMADRLMDKTRSDFSHVFGVIISVITNSITSIHAMAAGVAASGPAGMAQAAIMISSSIISTASLVQAEAQRQALDRNKDNIGDSMFK
jgi:chromosome segregation ATPase